MTPRFFSRRLLVLGTTAGILLGGCATGPAIDNSLPPIVFVHGNGDSAALWTTTPWRFESTGWTRERLFASDVPSPLARTDDSVPQDGRSSTTENMQALASEVDKALRASGASQVVLMASSRGRPRSQSTARCLAPSRHLDYRTVIAWSSRNISRPSTAEAAKACTV